MYTPSFMVTSIQPCLVPSTSPILLCLVTPTLVIMSVMHSVITTLWLRLHTCQHYIQQQYILKHALHSMHANSEPPPILHCTVNNQHKHHTSAACQRIQVHCVVAADFATSTDHACPKPVQLLSTLRQSSRHECAACSTPMSRCLTASYKHITATTQITDGLDTTCTAYTMASVWGRPHGSKNPTYSAVMSLLNLVC